MAETIRRMRYFDGEFLRSTDLSDEQGYHVAMRRKLTLGLHSAGIASGLAIVQDDNSAPPALLFFSVTAGLAIDQDGREIVIVAPYLLSQDNVLARAGLQAGDNEVWITYVEYATGLPQAGYAQCNAAAENTRMAEGFEIVLKAKGSAPAKGKDPDVDLRGIRLGTISLKNDTALGWTITAADSVGRTYVGVRAQSIGTPDDADHYTFQVTARNVDPAKPLAPPGYLDIAAGVFAHDNLFVEQNTVLGDDFALSGGTNPVPATLKKNGNLKVAGDLFLQGDFYGSVNGKWLGLLDVITAMMPKVVTGIASETAIGGASSGSVTVPFPDIKIPSGTLQASAGLAGFQLIAGAPNTDTLQVNVTAQPSWPATGPQIVLNWSCGLQTASGPNQIVPFDKLHFFYTLIVTPSQM